MREDDRESPAVVVVAQLFGAGGPAVPLLLSGSLTGVATVLAAFVIASSQRGPVELCCCC